MTIFKGFLAGYSTNILVIKEAVRTSETEYWTYSMVYIYLFYLW